MDIDDLEPLRKQPALRNLEPMSVDELEGYIGQLETEIARVRAAIAAKKNRRTDAESIFRR
jgi:uncharacterized small protein (DUF1192 family)